MRIDVYGDANGDRKPFELALRASCDELNIDLDLIDRNTSAPRDDPAIAVVFPSWGSAWTNGEAKAHAVLRAADFPVLPIITDAAGAGLLPEALKEYNAFQTAIWGTAWANGLVDEVLSHAWQQRHERRIFISYKRSESARAAVQLHQLLTRLGYVTFLDDVSIDRGVRFQHELKWWLSDADAVLMLLTPGFPNSRWCMEEVNFARASSVGLLVVEWPTSGPGATPAATASIADSVDADQRLRLDSKDFDGSPTQSPGNVALTGEGVLRVLAYCSRQRAVAIRQKLDDLVPLASQVLAKQALLTAVAGGRGDFEFIDQARKKCFVRVLPFRPDARSLHDAFQAAGTGQYEYAGCLYVEFDVLDPRAVAIKWLAERDTAPSPETNRLRVWACVGDEVNP